MLINEFMVRTYTLGYEIMFHTLQKRKRAPLQCQGSTFDFTFFAELCVGKNAFCEMNTKIAV